MSLAVVWLVLVGCVRPPPASVVAARNGSAVRVELPDGRVLEVGATEVTQGDWEARMGEHGSTWARCPTCPVAFVSWFDAAAYANARSEADGLEACYVLDGCEVAPPWSRRTGPGNVRLHPRGLRCAAVTPAKAGCEGWRLPTRSEWLTFSPVVDPDEPRRSIQRRAVSGHADQPSPVASREPNAFGLYDTVGNLDEWLDEPVGPPSNAMRERAAEPLWCSTAGDCFGTPMRTLLEPVHTEREVASWGRHCLGFRVVRTVR